MKLGKPLPSKEFRWWKRGTIVFGMLFIILLIALIHKEQPSTPKKIIAAQPEVTPDDDPFVGDEDAPVTIIEFADFQCPYCKQVHDDTFALLQKYYLNTGKVKFVYRDLPQSDLGHAWSEKAAEAAECAHEQGKFWDMHHLLFANQQSLNNLQQQASEPNKNTILIHINDKNVLVDLTDVITTIKKIASQTGMDMTQFNTCLDGGKKRGEIEQDKADAAKANIKATPTFVINGKKIEGAIPFDTLQAFIERELFI